MRFSRSLTAGLLLFPVIWPVLCAAPAIAQDRTYRAGKPYGTAPATEAAQCADQCAGDAACRGWNFIRLTPKPGQDVTAICEFNAVDVRPIASTISQSGRAEGVRTSPNLIEAGTNTTRIGLPRARTVPNARPERGRTTVRQPVAQRIPPQPAATGLSPVLDGPDGSTSSAPRLSARMPAPRPRFQHNLDTAPQALPQYAPQYAPGYAPQHVFERRPNAEPAAVTRRQAVNGPASNAVAPPPRRASLPAAASPSPMAARRPASMAAPIPKSIPPQPMRSQPASPRSIPPQTGAVPPRAPTVAAAQQSLFGSLYDDVSVPAPVDPAALAQNPDGPIATQARKPVAPGRTPLAETFGPPPASQLAGGR